MLEWTHFLPVVDHLFHVVCTVSLAVAENEVAVEGVSPHGQVQIINSNHPCI